MTPRGLILLLGTALVTLPEANLAQEPSSWATQWRVCRMTDGLPESACISVALSPQGRILARHPRSGSVSELDGYATHIIPSPGQGSSRVYQSPGGQLWTVASHGLQEFRSGKWVLHPTSEIAAAFRERILRVNNPIPLCPARQGFVLILLPDHLLEFNTEDPEHPRTQVLLAAAQTQLGEFSTMTLARDGGLWITGTRGLLKMPGPVRNLKAGTAWHQYLLPEALQGMNLQEPHENEAGGVTMLAESSASQLKRLVQWDGQHWSAQAIPVEGARHAWCSANKTCWAVTTDSLFKWEAGTREAIPAERAPGRRYYDLAIEPGGAFWLATSDGLFRYAPHTWRTPAFAERLDSPVHHLTGGEADRFWFVVGTGLHLVQNGHHQEFPLPAEALTNLPNLRALYPLKNGSLLLQAGEQCLQFPPDTRTFDTVVHEPPATSLKPLGLLRDGRLCVQTLTAGAPVQSHRLEAYDGARFEAMAVPLHELLPGSNLSSFFTAQNGDLWLGGDRGTAWFHEQKWRTIVSTDQSSPESVVGFAELADGKIWCATSDKVWVFDGRTWSAVRVGFDRINAFVSARDGCLWVATESGLSRNFRGAWVENGIEDGLPSAAVRDILEDPRGRIWAATTRGLSLYYPEADPAPPDTEVQVVTGNAQRIPEGGSITLSFSGKDKWNHTSRQRLLYSYRLDEHEWSTFQEERNVSFVDLAGGKHYFQVRAMDRNCNVDPTPARLDFLVILPWYKESRAVIFAILGLVVALFFASLAFNSHRQLLRSYAEVEREVAQRTRELELANRQLLHSQKMNALGTLAAGIAHDFNNILSIIKGSAQIIEDNPGDPQKVSTRVDRIKTVVEQGAGIVKAMLGFSRQAAEQPAPCDLNAVLEDSVKLLGDRFLREVQITLEHASALPEVTCSRDLVQQVLLNFIFNAAESMTQRKQIRLATRRMEKPAANPVLAPAPAAEYVAVSVQDAGSGITPENLPRIFEPFFTTKAFSARRGTGLGLSMVYELARKMEAGLAVESTVGQGSTFTLILPVRNKATAKP